MEVKQKILELKVSDNKLTAELTLTNYEDDDGNIVHFTYSELKSFLSDHKILYGIKEDVLNEIIDNKVLLTNASFLVAEGVPAVHGKNGYIEYLYENEEDKADNKKGKNDRVDFYNINVIPSVEKGALLAKRHHPTQGEDGLTVYNSRIPGKEGKTVSLKTGKNVILSEDHDYAYAAADGQITITEKNRLNVFEAYNVKGDVDFSTGNINFIGNVVIQGSILSGFEVKADGDIEIHGNVEGSIIKAKGSVWVYGGILGQDKAVIKAGKDVHAKFIQQAKVDAGQDITVSQAIINSDVSAGGAICCKSGRGQIMGGRLRAGDTIEAKMIGNKSYIHTHLEIGVKPSVRKEMEDIQKELQMYEANLAKAKQNLSVLSKLSQKLGKLPPDKMEINRKLKLYETQAEHGIAELKEQLELLEEELNENRRSKVTIWDKLYPGTVLTFFRYSMPVHNEYTHVYFILKNEEICACPL